MTLPPGKITYKCTRCGACCRWPGDVCLEDGELENISAFLNITADEFANNFCRLRANRKGLSIAEHKDGACLMLKDGACSINPVKPAQCRDFPNKWNFPGWQEVCQAIPCP